MIQRIILSIILDKLFIKWTLTNTKIKQYKQLNTIYEIIKKWKFEENYKKTVKFTENILDENKLKYFLKEVNKWIIYY